MSLTIHHAPQSRSTRLLWLLEELGADYDIHYVEIERQGGQGHADPSPPDSWNDLRKAGYAALDQRWRKAIKDGGYILGEFSALDILYGSLLQWFRAAMPPGEPYDSYAQRIGGRPALKRAWAKDSPEGHV